MHANFFPVCNPLFTVNLFRHCSTPEIRNVSELIAFAVANLYTFTTFFLFPFLFPLIFFLSSTYSRSLQVKLHQQTEKCIYERNVQGSRRLRCHGTTLITFAAHVSYIYPDGKYAISPQCITCTDARGVHGVPINRDQHEWNWVGQSFVLSAGFSPRVRLIMDLHKHSSRLIFLYFQT